MYNTYSILSIISCWCMYNVYERSAGIYSWCLLIVHYRHIHVHIHVYMYMYKSTCMYTYYFAESDIWNSLRLSKHARTPASAQNCLTFSWMSLETSLVLSIFPESISRNWSPFAYNNWETTVNIMIMNII